jgi:hypothetical protein
LRLTLGYLVRRLSRGADEPGAWYVLWGARGLFGRVLRAPSSRGPSTASAPMPDLLVRHPAHPRRRMAHEHADRQPIPVAQTIDSGWHAAQAAERGLRQARKEKNRTTGSWRAVWHRCTENWDGQTPPASPSDTAIRCRPIASQQTIGWWRLMTMTFSQWP